MTHAWVLKAGLEVSGNAVQGEGSAALFRGAWIGPKQDFNSDTTFGGVFMAAAGYYQKRTSLTLGQRDESLSRPEVPAREQGPLWLGAPNGFRQRWNGEVLLSG